MNMNNLKSIFRCKFHFQSLNVYYSENCHLGRIQVLNLGNRVFIAGILFTCVPRINLQQSICLLGTPVSDILG